MALTLTLREGHDFFIGDRRFVVASVVTPLNFVVEAEDGHRYMLDPDDWSDVGPNVRLTSGIPRKQDGKIVRVMIEAPGRKVLRGDLYRDSMRHPISTPSPDSVSASQPVSGSCPTCHGRGVLTQEIACQQCGGHGCVNCGQTGFVTDTFKCPECGGR